MYDMDTNSYNASARRINQDLFPIPERIAKITERIDEGFRNKLACFTEGRLAG